MARNKKSNQLTRVCAVCSADFDILSERSKAVYCSDACKQQAYLKRKATKSVVTSKKKSAEKTSEPQKSLKVNTQLLVKEKQRKVKETAFLQVPKTEKTTEDENEVVPKEKETGNVVVPSITVKTKGTPIPDPEPIVESNKGRRQEEIEVSEPEEIKEKKKKYYKVKSRYFEIKDVEDQLVLLEEYLDFDGAKVKRKELEEWSYKALDFVEDEEVLPLLVAVYDDVEGTLNGTEEKKFEYSCVYTDSIQDHFQAYQELLDQE